MSQQALTQLYQQNNAPQYTLSLIQWELLQALKEGEISDIIYAQMNKNVADLSVVQTGCDRIANTPIPLPIRFCSTALFTFSALCCHLVWVLCLD